MTDRVWTPLTRSIPSYNRGQMRISLTTQGMLLINQFAFHALRSPAAVSVFYEKNAGLIGIVPAEPGTPNALNVRKRNPGNQRTISLIHFCASFGLAKPERKIDFTNPTFDPDGTLVLDHRKAISELERLGVQ